EMRVAEAAVAAGGQPEALAFADEIDDQRLLVLLEDLGSHRHLHRHACAICAGAVAAHAVYADRRLEMLLIAEIDQRVEAVDGLDPDVPAAPAVAAVRAAELDEFLAPEGNGAGPAVPGPDIYFGFVQKFHRPPSIIAMSSR